MQSGAGFVKLIVTGRWPHVARQIKSELRKAAPGAQIRLAGFRSVFILEAAGDVLELAQRINRDCAEYIGHATPALLEIESEIEAIKDAAVKIGYADRPRRIVLFSNLQAWPARPWEDYAEAGGLSWQCD